MSASADLKVQVSYRQIRALAFPISIALLIPQLNLLINSIFLGNLSTEALGNAGITGVFYLIFAVAGHGLNNAVQSVLSRHAGAGDHGAFSGILQQGFRLGAWMAATGIVLTWFAAPLLFQRVADPASYPAEMDFLRVRILGLPFLYAFQLGNAFLVATLQTRLLFIAFIGEAIVNILFDYLLIFGHAGFPALGFQGAAWASVFAEIAGCLIVFTVIYRKGYVKTYQLKWGITYLPAYFKPMIQVGIPLILQYVISVATWLVFFLLIEALHDPTGKAISNTMRNIFGLGGIFIWAFAATANTMVSNLIGQGAQHQVLTAVRRITWMSLGTCLALVTSLNLIPQLFFSLFDQPHSFIDQAVPVLRIVSVGMIMMSMANVWLNAVTGTGKTRVNLVIEIVAILIYLLHSFYFTQWHYTSLPISWTNEFVYWGSIGLMAAAFLWSKRWMQKPSHHPTEN